MPLMNVVPRLHNSQMRKVADAKSEKVEWTLDERRKKKLRLDQKKLNHEFKAL